MNKQGNIALAFWCYVFGQWSLGLAVCAFDVWAGYIVMAVSAIAVGLKVYIAGKRTKRRERFPI